MAGLIFLLVLIAPYAMAGFFFDPILRGDRRIIYFFLFPGHFFLLKNIEALATGREGPPESMCVGVALFLFNAGAWGTSTYPNHHVDFGLAAFVIFVYFICLAYTRGDQPK